MPGSSLARPPVAIIMLLASYIVFLPSADVTSTFFPFFNMPLPKIVSILFFFNKNWIPLLIPSATPRLRLIIASKSALPPSTVMPYSDA